jgi:hypothetical protein
MKTHKYSVNHHPLETILAWVKANEIAIPEIQRPFVWDAIKVRDLIDSLYHGYPIGYLISWRNPDVKLKNGTTSEGKKILIDGQQRVLALNAAILGDYVINKDYRKIRIKIAFNPIEEKFEVLNTAIEKDNSWLPDISKIFSDETSLLELVDDYHQKNSSVNRNFIFERTEHISKITGRQIGLIELDQDLDIETVTEIFIRINSAGVVLSQADFAMSKIAANEKYGGSTLRKCIDYFCHLAVSPESYVHIAEADREFAGTDYFRRITWLKDEKENLYDPAYTDLLRVAFTSEFERGKLADLVSLLSGRNFEKKTYEDEIAKSSFASLEKGTINFINENNFNKFLMIVKSAGFISPNLIRSQNALNFAYILYLKLRDQGYKPENIERYVRKWFVLSTLTGRYSASPETAFDFDIKNISKRPFDSYLKDVEDAELSGSFWNVALVQDMNTSVASSPYFNVYLASQVKADDKGFLSKDITVKDLISNIGDIHHVFPRDYLKRNGLKRAQYNQIANYVYMQSEINIQVGCKAPNEYFDELKEQCESGESKYGGITDFQALKENLTMNCIPESIFSMDINNYEDFLAKRRALMADKIKNYYFSL